jgi:hypothetical protein
MGRPRALEVALLSAAGVMFYVAFFVLDSTPGKRILISKPKQRPFYLYTHPTSYTDYLLLALRALSVGLLLYAVYRWQTRGEKVEELDPAQEQRRFGDHIQDVRMNQDPLVGMLPVQTTPRDRR